MRVPPPKGSFPQTEASQEGFHQGVRGVLATLGSQGGEEDIVNGTLLLSELLGRRKKRLNNGLRGKEHLLVLSVNVAGSREAIEWALEQDCSVLMIQEHRMLGNTLKGIMNQAKWKGRTGVWGATRTKGKQSRSGRYCRTRQSPSPDLQDEGWEGREMAQGGYPLAKGGCPSRF